MGSRLTIPAPTDYRLARDACSYGYFLLAPNRWRPESRTLERVLRLAEGPTLIAITQDDTPGASLRVRADRAIQRAERRELAAQVTRMLRLDEDAGTVGAFHAADPRFRPVGRGRLFRSPTFFEDVIKTVTSCNVAWPSTVSMNRRLCEAFGDGGSFPTSRRLARVRPASLRARCGVGYRDARIVELAKRFEAGPRRGIDVEWFENPDTPDDEIHEALIELPGIGPYAAANIMQLLGRYGRLPLDTESVRHGRSVLGMKGTDAQVMRAVHHHFAPFGAHAFRSYWFELWEFYERKRGPAWTWERETTGKTFTAAQLKN